MANVIRIKRRASGLAGAPVSLKSAELAHNEVDNTLYVGKGDDGSGNATTIVPVGGAGAFVDLSAAQTIGGVKTFAKVPSASEDASANNNLVRKSQFDTGLSGKANSSHSHVVGDVSGLQTALDGKASSIHIHTISDVTGLQDALAAKAPAASPSLTGTPTAPTATGGTNSTQIATTAFVQAALAAVINGAPGALDTLKELADALGNDASFAATITNALASKLAASANLSDLANTTTARSNLGLGTMAVQNASNVAITGGSIDGVTLDGGTF